MDAAKDCPGSPYLPILSLRHGPRSFVLKAQRAEALPIEADFLLGNPFPDEARGDGREQNTAAKMSGGHQQAFQIGGPENGKMIGRIGPQACPGFFDARVLEAGSEL